MAKPKGAPPRLLRSGARTCVYTVQEGETLADILRQSGANVPALQARNARCDLFHLQPGQRLRVPWTAHSGVRTYRVRKNEDVYTLARKCGSSVAALLQANPHLRPGEIRCGAHIALPKE
jgi:Predicted glycosyl hydrolase